MIKCSPQELIAESLYNCYMTSEPYRLHQPIKSQSKPLHSHNSLRKSDKISLKKTSCSKESNKIQKVASAKCITIQKQMPPPITYIPQSYRIIPQQKVMEIRINRLPPQKIEHKIIFPTFSYETSHRIQKIQVHNPYAEPDRKQYSANKLSTAETLHSSGGFQPYPYNQFPQKNRQKTFQNQYKTQPYRHADKNQEHKLEPVLQSLKPKIVQSQFDSEQIFEDEYSEVISSYYQTTKQYNRNKAR